MVGGGSDNDCDSGKAAGCDVVSTGAVVCCYLL